MQSKHNSNVLHTFEVVEALYNHAGRIDRGFVRGRLREIPIADMARFVPLRGLIVDLGCGRGEFSNFLKVTGEEREILGYDLAADRIGIAKETVHDRSDIGFEVGDVRDIELPKCVCIVLSEVLYLISFLEQEEVLRSCFEHLESGGVLVVKTWDIRPRWKYILGGIKTGLIHACISLSNVLLNLIPFRSLREDISRLRAKFLGERTSRPYFRASEDYIELFESIGFQVKCILAASEGEIPGSIFRSPIVFVCMKDSD